jgi:hypothetical protein
MKAGAPGRQGGIDDNSSLEEVAKDSMSYRAECMEGADGAGRVDILEAGGFAAAAGRGGEVEADTFAFD